MRKLLATILSLALVVGVPASALADETKSVSDYCQEASQAETSEAMVQKIHEAFGAMKVEAEADPVRVKEVTPDQQMDPDDGDEEEDEEDDEGFPVCNVTRNGKTMQYLISDSNPDAQNKPLYIALHGGGTAETSLVNDMQWSMMFQYYRTQLGDGVYIACRGMEDVWNMHYLPEAYAMYDRIIEDMVLLKNVDPNRVYLLGFSAGGDGVYQIAPRMADRFAAANMSSGHPNDVSLLNLANLPFELQVGVRDFFSVDAMRSIKAAAFEKTLNDYRNTYGFGYEHRTLVHVPEGHNFNDNCVEGNPNSLVLKDPATFASRAVEENWMRAFADIYVKYYDPEEMLYDLDDPNDFAAAVEGMSYQQEQREEGRDITAEDEKIYAEFNAELTKKITGTGEGEFGLKTETVDTYAVHYVDDFTRDYCPRQLVWDLTTRAPERTVTSSYWLKADKSVDKGLITASFDAESNTFKLNPSDDLSGDFSVLINPHMVDVSRPVTFDTPKGTFTVTVAADPKVVEASLREVTDPYLAWVQEVSYQELKNSDEPEPEPEPTTHDYTATGGGTWTKGGNATLPFAFERTGEATETRQHFVRVLVDGAEVPADAYEVSTDRFTVSLKPAYLQTLATGNHTITAVFDDGEASATFVIAEAKADDKKDDKAKPMPSNGKSKLPKTGDAPLVPIALCAGLGVVALAAAGLVLKPLDRRSSEE